MIVYRGSDVKHSWEDEKISRNEHRMCDYVKEGNETTGKCILTL